MFRPSASMTKAPVSAAALIIAWLYNWENGRVRIWFWARSCGTGTSKSRVPRMPAVIIERRLARRTGGSKLLFATLGLGRALVDCDIVRLHFLRDVLAEQPRRSEDENENQHR